MAKIFRNKFFNVVHNKILYSRKWKHHGIFASIMCLFKTLIRDLNTDFMKA